MAELACSSATPANTPTYHRSLPTHLHPQEGYQRKELAWGSAAGMAAMAALCLWRGFKEDE